MEVAPNVFKITFPLPFEFDHVNCYLLRGSYGWTIIDAGLKNKTSNFLWEDVFKSYGIKYSDIEGIYISHYHPDHYGASGHLQELTGAPVYMHRARKC